MFLIAHIHRLDTSEARSLESFFREIKKKHNVEPSISLLNTSDETTGQSRNSMSLMHPPFSCRESQDNGHESSHYSLCTMTGLLVFSTENQPSVGGSLAVNISLIQNKEFLDSVGGDTFLSSLFI